MSASDDYIATRDKRAAEAGKDRQRAEKLWRRLQAEDPASWKSRVLDEAVSFSWAFCERICDESAGLVESDLDRAEELAALAVALAPAVPGEDNRVSAMQEYAWLHLGNVRRARGDLAGAEEALRRGKEFFLGAMAGIWPSHIKRGRLEGLEALLLRDQGKLGEAMKKIDFGLGLSDRSDTRPVLLLEKGRLQRRFGQPEEAAKELARAAEIASEGSDARLVLRIAVELGAALCDADRHGEVKIPAAVRKEALGLAVERARLRCLDGRVAAGLGRLKEAQAVLNQDPAELPARTVADFALLSLEIAAIHARDGRTDDLKRLAESMPRLVEGAALNREALVILKLASRLAVQDKLPAERAAQCAKDFARLSAGR